MVATWPAKWLHSGYTETGQSMARPKKSDAPDLSEAQELTAGAIERLTCPTGKQQAFMRDTKAPGLRVRVTAAGAKSYVFEAKLNRQTIRRTLGDVRTLSIEDARDAARCVEMPQALVPKRADHAIVPCCATRNNGAHGTGGGAVACGRMMRPAWLDRHGTGTSICPRKVR